MKHTAPGTNKTGFHLFSQGRSRQDIFSGRVLNDWRLLSDDEREQYTSRAEHGRVIAKAIVPAPLDIYLETLTAEDEQQGPWNISSLHGEFAVHPSVIQQEMPDHTMRERELQWRSLFPERVEAAPDFPDTVPADGPVLRHIDESHADSVKAMLEMLRLHLRFSDQTNDAGILVQWVSSTGRMVIVFVGHSMHLDRNMFEAELIEMTVVGDVTYTKDGHPQTPFLVSFVRQEMGGDIVWPNIMTEEELALTLATDVNEEWQMWHLDNTPVSMDCRKVHSRRKVERARLMLMDHERLANIAAMKLFKSVAGLTARKKPRAKASRSKSAKMKGKTVDKASDASQPNGPSAIAEQSASIKKVKVMTPDDSSSDPPDSSESETQSEEGIPLDKPILEPPASGPVATASGPGAAGTKGGPAGIKYVAPRAHRAAPGERVIEVWADKFPFARIERSGRLCGYGVSCLRHTNADGTGASTDGKQSIAIGKAGLSEDECRKRLKR